MGVFLMNLLIALSLQKIGAVPGTLIWADIDTTNDSIMWYATECGDYGFDKCIYHDNQMVKRVKYTGYIDGLQVSDIAYKVYDNNVLKFVIVLEDTSTWIDKFVFMDEHGEIYREEDLSDIISGFGTRTGYQYPSGEDWVDTTRLDTITNGHCIGFIVGGIIDTQFVKINFRFEGYNTRTEQTDTFGYETYVDLNQRRLLDREHYPYLYGGPTRKGNHWIAVRHDTVFVDDVSSDPVLLYKVLLPKDADWSALIDEHYFEVVNSEILIYELSSGRFVKAISIDSLPFEYQPKSSYIGGKFVNNDTYYYVGTYEYHSFFIYSVPDFQLVNKYEDTTSVLLSGIVLDTGSVVYVRVPPTKDTIYVDYKAPDGVPTTIFSYPITPSKGSQPAGIWKFSDSYVTIPTLDTTYIFRLNK